MFEFSIDKNSYSNVHFIGIGGISMSGLAKILLDNGYKVSGSDTKDSEIIKKLKALGAEIHTSHSAENINNSDLVIYTDAISEDNEELRKAFKLNIPVVDRATFLGALMKNFKSTIAVSGTHGKTTTTSMLSTILNRSDLDPTILLGGDLDEIGGNIKLGSKDLLLTEACEYKGNILKYFPKTSIILNIDEDHLDFFDGIDHIKETFVQYARNLSKDSLLIINLDDPNSQAVIDATSASVLSFGISPHADFRAQNIRFTKEGFPSYTLNYKDKEFFNIELSVMGSHNIYNSMASVIAAKNEGLNKELIEKNIKIYSGVHRRLEFKGFYNGVKIIDDYAHHPTEIKTSLHSIRLSKPGKIYCIFQPHTYTRTKLLFKNFSEAFGDADKIIITDIYAAREKDNGMVHSRDLSKALTEKGLDASYIKNFEDIADYLHDNAEENDVIVTMGAGSIYSLSEILLNKEKEKAAV